MTPNHPTIQLYPLRSPKKDLEMAKVRLKSQSENDPLPCQAVHFTGPSSSEKSGAAMSPCASPVCHAWLIQQTDPDHPIEVGSGVPRTCHWEVGMF